MLTRHAPALGTAPQHSATSLRSVRFFVQRVQHERGMGVCSSGAHFGGHPDRLHQFLRRSACSACCLGVPLDAVWALGNVRDRDRDGDDLLDLCWQSAVGEDRVAEGIKSRLLR